MEIKFYDYQQPFYDAIINKLFIENVKSVLGVLPTGGGKSVIIGGLANRLPGRTLVLTHREEILTQNSEWIKNVGLLSSKIDTIKWDNKVVICMVQTLDARIKKYGIEYLGAFDNIILDEVQILIFEKVFSQYNYKRLIGFTGTPVLDKKIYTEIDGVEFVEDYTLSLLFDDIVIGPDTQDLIDAGKLCQDYNIVLNLPDFDKLKESDSSPDGYTKKSLNEVYQNTASLNILTEAYNKYGKGKKTLIFNASTKINKFVYDHFVKLGINVKIFDSVNDTGLNPETGKKWTRKQIVKWFKESTDGVLINTNVFTTGFDDREVECILMNRATKSLSLFIQIAGRGGRSTTKIYKDKFTFVDLGQNIHTHGRWSEKRDWKQYFYSSGPRRRNKMDMLSTWECDFCNSLNIMGEVACDSCQMPKTVVVTEKSEKKNKDGELIELQKMPPPRARNIIDYTKAIGEDDTFAFRLLRNKIIELFQHHNVQKDYYINKRNLFHKRIKEIFTPIYFAIIKDKDFLNQKMIIKRRKLDTEIGIVIKKIDKKYGYKETK